MQSGTRTAHHTVYQHTNPGAGLLSTCARASTKTVTHCCSLLALYIALPRSTAELCLHSPLAHSGLLVYSHDQSHAQGACSGGGAVPPPPRVFGERALLLHMTAQQQQTAASGSKQQQQQQQGHVPGKPNSVASSPWPHPTPSPQLWPLFHAAGMYVPPSRSRPQAGHPAPLPASPHPHARHHCTLSQTTLAHARPAPPLAAWGPGLAV